MENDERLVPWDVPMEGRSVKDDMTLCTVRIGVLSRRPDGDRPFSFVDLPGLSLVADPKENLSSVLQRAGSKMQHDGMTYNIGTYGLWCYSCCSAVNEPLSHERWVSRCLAGGVGVDDKGILIGDDQFDATLTVRELIRAIPAPESLDADLAIAM